MCVCESPDVHRLERYLLKLKNFFADIKVRRLGDLHKNRDGKCILHLHKLSLSSLVIIQKTKIVDKAQLCRSLIKLFWLSPQMTCQAGSIQTQNSSARGNIFFL